MGNKLRRFFGLEDKEKEQREVITPTHVFGEALTFSDIFNRYTAMNISAFFAATNLIANTIAMLPIKVLSQSDDGNNEIDSHPIVMSFNDPYNKLSRFTIIKNVIESVILRGNGFIYIERGQDGTVVGLRFLQADDVTINYNDQKNTLWYQAPKVSRKRIEPCDMLHFLLHSHDGVIGIPLLVYAARTLEITNASENSANNFFKNGCNVSGVLKVHTPLNAKQKEEIRSSWNQANSGNGTGGLAILNCNMDYQAIQLTPEQSQLLSSRQYNIGDIARFFNINPLLLGGESNVSYSSLEMLQNAFLVHTLQPYVTMIETELNRKLLKPSENGLEVVIETNDLLRIDKKSQADYYKIMVDSGILSRNEIRKEIGYSNFEGGDDHTVAYSDAAQNTIEDKDLNNIT